MEQGMQRSQIVENTRRPDHNQPQSDLIVRSKSYHSKKGQQSPQIKQKFGSSSKQPSSNRKEVRDSMRKNLHKTKPVKKWSIVGEGKDGDMAELSIRSGQQQTSPKKSVFDSAKSSGKKHVRSPKKSKTAK